MGRLKNRIDYVTPQTEIVVIRSETNFLDSLTSTSFTASFGFGDSGVDDGGELL